MTTVRVSSSGDALCFQNEYSEVVWQYRLYYKAFAETKPRLLARKQRRLLARKWSKS